MPLLKQQDEPKEQKKEKRKEREKGKKKKKDKINRAGVVPIFEHIL